MSTFQYACTDVHVGQDRSESNMHGGECAHINVSGSGAGAVGSRWSVKYLHK